MFVVYSKDGCPYCDKVSNLLQFLELKHVVYKLDRDFTRESFIAEYGDCLLYTSPSPRDQRGSRMPSSA